MENYRTKYTDANAPRLFEGDELGKLAGVRIGQSTNVGISGTGTTTKYWVYVVGKGAVAAVNLGEGQIGSSERNPQVSVLRHQPSAADPAGVIGGSLSYNFRENLKRRSAMDGVKSDYIGEHLSEKIPREAYVH